MAVGTRKVEPFLQLDSGLIIPTGAAAGKVLTSDSSGNASWQASAGAVYASNVGNGSATTITVTHNLGTQDVSVVVYRATSPYDEIQCTVENATTNTVILTFASAPSSGQYRCVVQAGGAGIAIPTIHTDKLQAGFVGNVNSGPVTATINSSTGVLSFGNWPTTDVCYFAPTTSGNPLVRNICPAALTGVGPGGSITSGDYVYLRCYLNVTAQDGTASVSVNIGASRTTAALAAADCQLGGTFSSGQILVWDGVAHFTSSTYSLVSANGGSVGQLFPATTGRDRRAWAKGYDFSQAESLSTSTTTTTNWVPLDSTNLSQRVESLSGTVRLRLSTQAYSPSANQAGIFGFIIDGATTGVTWPFTYYQDAGSSTPKPVHLEIDLALAAGSHLIQPAFLCVSGGIAVANLAGAQTVFTVEELEQFASNGTA